MMGMTALLVAGCGERLPDEMLNDVFCGFSGTRDAVDGASITYIESQNLSTTHVFKNICVFTSLCVLQTYRLENNRIVDFRCLNYRDLKNHAIYQDYVIASETLNQQPNLLQLENEPLLSLENGLNIIVDMYYPSRWDEKTIAPPNRILWDRWRVQKWVGTSDEVPSEIEMFFKNAILATLSPTQSCIEDYGKFGRSTERAAAVLPDIRNYPAYLRAVPVFTEKEVEAERDTPLVNLELTRQNVQYAIKFPYILFPIPPGRSPFPSIRNYTAGDKFKVNVGNECFLIETFTNGNLMENTQK